MIDKQPLCGHATAVPIKSHLFHFISFIYSQSPKIIGKDGFSYLLYFKAAIYTPGVAKTKTKIYKLT